MGSPAEQGSSVLDCITVILCFGVQTPTNSQGLLPAKYESRQRDSSRGFLGESQLVRNWSEGWQWPYQTSLHLCRGLDIARQIGITVVSCTLFWLVHHFPRNISPDPPPHTQHLIFEFASQVQQSTQDSLSSLVL